MFDNLKKHFTKKEYLVHIHLVEPTISKCRNNISLGNVMAKILESQLSGVVTSSFINVEIADIMMTWRCNEKTLNRNIELLKNGKYLNQYIKDYDIRILERV